MNHLRQRSRNYADIPPPTPAPDDSEYEDFQQQQQRVAISQRNSAVSLAAQERGYGEDELIPTYDEIMRRTNSEASYDTALTMRPQAIPVPMAHSASINSSASSSASTSPPQPTIQPTRSRHGVSTAQYIADRAAAFTRKQNLKTLGLNFLNAKQHLALSMCRDIVLLQPLYHAFRSFKYCYELFMTMQPIASELDYVNMLTTASPSEYFVTGIWCIVAAYLSFSVIDGLMVRWIVTYQTSAAILRVLAMSMMLTTIEQAALALFSPEGSYALHTWILISLVLTVAYIVQNFVTSNLDLKDGNRKRTIDYYSIAVFAVVPVGLASFVSMISLLRSLLIIRLDLNGKELLVGSTA